jgi:hypothetical protein
MCASDVDGRCFWLMDETGSGSCVVKNKVVCSDLVVKAQCDGDNVPSLLKDECYWLLMEEGGNGSCVVKNNITCNDVVVKTQCDGDNVPSPLKDECYWLLGSNSCVSKSSITSCGLIEDTTFCSSDSNSYFSQLISDSQQYKCYWNSELESENCIVNYPCSFLKENCFSYFDDYRCFQNGFI